MIRSILAISAAAHLAMIAPLENPGCDEEYLYIPTDYIHQKTFQPRQQAWRQKNVKNHQTKSFKKKRNGNKIFMG